MDLKGKEVLVIGGATGFGFATAQLVEQLGGKVVIAGHNVKKNEKALAQLSDRATSHYVDVLKKESIVELFQRLNKVDHIFITASPGGTSDVVDAPSEIEETYIYGKFWSTVMVTTSAVQHISTSGSITYTTGGLAKNPTKGTVLATAAYRAVEGFAKAMLVEMAPIRFNVIRPGFIDSGFWDSKDINEKKKLLEENKKRTAVNRVGTSKDIAQMAVSLMINSFVNGQIVEVDGGQLPKGS